MKRESANKTNEMTVQMPTDPICRAPLRRQGWSRENSTVRQKIRAEHWRKAWDRLKSKPNMSRNSFPRRKGVDFLRKFQKTEQSKSFGERARPWGQIRPPSPPPLRYHHLGAQKEKRIQNEMEAYFPRGDPKFSLRCSF